MNSILPMTAPVIALEISSPAFPDKNYIPEKYTRDGENVNPALVVDKIPGNTKSLVLIVDDPIESVRPWTHWLVWNISPVKRIKENDIPGVQGINDFGKHNYEGPCPPSGTHRYHFKIYALNSLLDLDPGSGRTALEKAMSPHVIGFGEITGLYKRKP